MKKIFSMLIMIMVLLIGCSDAPKIEQQIETEPLAQEAPQTQVESAPVEETQSQSAASVPEDEATPTSNSGVKEFEMISKRFAFEPNVLSVSMGDTVIMHITSADVAHGIAIPEFGVNTYLPAGETVDVEFVADAKGEFPFRCNVFCGSGHGQMTGKVVVQ